MYGKLSCFQCHVPHKLCFVQQHKYGSAQFKLYTRVQVHACACTFNAFKLKKLACARTVARDFGMCTWESKHTRHTRDAHHELALGLPHYTRVV